MNESTPSPLAPDAVLLGTVALEPNRWGALSPDRKPTVRAADWVARAEDAGFDGIELWEHHATLVDAEEVARLQASALPLSILSTYASFDDDDPTDRDAAAAWAVKLGCVGIKFNVGNDRRNPERYIERLARFAQKAPSHTSLICECHAGTAADDPSVAETILSAVGEPERIQALVHLGDEPRCLDAMFAALGDRITHVHVNFLRQGAPRLSDIADELRARVAQIRERGFAGSYTIEFVHGTGGEADRPPALLDAAIADLAQLREILAS